MVLHVFVQLKELRKVLQVIFFFCNVKKTFDFLYELGLGKLGTVNCKEHLLQSLPIIESVESAAFVTTKNLLVVNLNRTRAVYIGLDVSRLRKE